MSPGFTSLARVFDKMFSLYANYPNGIGEVFRQWTKANHAGELLFHAERACSGGRQDIASMAAMTIFGANTTVLSSWMIGSAIIAVRVKISLHATS